MLNVSVIAMGMTAILLQVTVLRELISVFSGNELDIGITLSVWLLAVGAGSFAGRKVRLQGAFSLSFLIVALLAQPTLLGISLIRPLLSAEFGEAVSLSATVLATLVTLFPLCFAIGAQFPLAVSHCAGRTSKVYGLEAAGSFLGGMVFTLFLSGRVDAVTLSAAISALNIFIAALLLRRHTLAILLAIPLLVITGPGRIITARQWPGAELVQRVESRYGEIDVLRVRAQLSVYASGKLQFSYPDLQTEEMKAHLPMALRPLPARVLVIGGSPAVLKGLLQYPVEAIDFVELDPAMIRVSLGLLDEQDRTRLKDNRLTMVTADARQFIRTSRESRYDLMLLNLPEPSTANINRFYTVEFFQEAHRALNPGGAMVLSLPVSFGYMGKHMQLANGSVFNSLREVFKHVELSSEEYGVLAASDDPIDTNPDLLGDRFVKRGITASFFHPTVLNDVFSPLKVNAARMRLGAVNAVNTDTRPAAYLYNLMVWAEMQGGGILTFLPDYGGRSALLMLALIAGAAAFFRKKKTGVYFSVFLTGYSAMAFSLIIVLAYQAAFGYVYEMIGLLAAVFMAGMAIGAYGMQGAGRPLPRLGMLQAGTILLFVSSPLSLGHEVSYYVLNLLVGIAAGGEFSAASQFMQGRDPADVAGKLYAFDLTGSFLGALLTAIIFVPLFGIQRTIFFVAALKTVSLVLLLSLRYEKA